MTKHKGGNYNVRTTEQLDAYEGVDVMIKRKLKDNPWDREFHAHMAEENRYEREASFPIFIPPIRHPNDSAAIGKDRPALKPKLN